MCMAHEEVGRHYGEHAAGSKDDSGVLSLCTIDRRKFAVSNNNKNLGFSVALPVRRGALLLYMPQPAT